MWMDEPTNNEWMCEGKQEAACECVNNKLHEQNKWLNESENECVDGEKNQKPFQLSNI